MNEDDDDQDDEQEEWDRDAVWTIDGDDGEGDVKDESAAYLEFLEEEVGASWTCSSQAKIKSKVSEIRPRFKRR